MRRPGVIAIAALSALLVALLVYGVAQQGNDRSLEAAIRKGARPLAPDTRLLKLDGSGTGTLADYRGKVVVLNFWASWCSTCLDEIPMLNDFQKRIGSRGTVVGVTFKDYAPDARRFERELKMTYPSLRDDKLVLAAKYGTIALPESFVIDRRGRLVAISRGTLTRKFLDGAFARALRT